MSAPSRPSRARGLKLPRLGRVPRHVPVAPLAGAWIETNYILVTEDGHTSRPSRARGLKLIRSSLAVNSLLVAPLAGAWIETIATSYMPCGTSCRAPRGRVD